MFAIIGFFTLGLAEISSVNEAKELASRLTERSFALANSSNFCFSDNFQLPENFYVAGKRVYYVLEIRKIEFGDAENPINSLVFSVYPREEIKKSYSTTDTDYTPNAIAADSFRTNAEIRLFGYEYEWENPTDSMIHSRPSDNDFEVDSIFIDPQAADIQLNAIEMIREVKLGKPYLYVIGCPSAACSADKTAVGKSESVHPPSPDGSDEGGFKC